MQHGGGELFELLDLPKDGYSEFALADNHTLKELQERFKDTWWEVIWPSYAHSDYIYSGVKCRYIADNLLDALRNHPREYFPNLDSQKLLYAYAIEEEIDDFLGDEIDFYPAFNDVRLRL